MKESGSRFSLFLMELVIDLFLFVLCAAVCVGLLLHARSMSLESTQLTQAVYLAQSAAEALRNGGGLPEVPEGYRCQVSRGETDGLSTAEIEIFWGDTSLYALETSWIPALGGDGGEEVARP